MTRVELEKEATDYAEKHHMKSYFAQADVYVDDKKEIINAILCFAEPREKRIADFEQLNSNQAESLRVIMLEEEKKRKRIEELETQMKKMKCCGNCNNTWNGMKLNICEDCKDHSKWEIKEND